MPHSDHIVEDFLCPILYGMFCFKLSNSQHPTQHYSSCFWKTFPTVLSLNISVTVHVTRYNIYFHQRIQILKSTTEKHGRHMRMWHVSRDRAWFLIRRWHVSPVHRIRSYLSRLRSRTPLSADHRELKWSIGWSIQERWVGYIEVRWRELRWEDVGVMRDEVRWGVVRWYEVKWVDVKWCEVKLGEGRLCELTSWDKIT